MTVLVRAAALSNYGQVARQVGLDPTKMLRRAKLDPAVLKNPDLRIPAVVVAALLEEFAAQSGCCQLWAAHGGGPPAVRSRRHQLCC